MPIAQSNTLEQILRYPSRQDEVHWSSGRVPRKWELRFQAGERLAGGRFGFLLVLFSAVPEETLTLPSSTTPWRSVLLSAVS